jgi:pimeloyl-ACP methyl ester carboxylesterase
VERILCSFSLAVGGWEAPVSAWSELMRFLKTQRFSMHSVRSQDGTRIVFDRLGQGPLLILIGGALQHRALDRQLGQRAEELAKHFTLIHYDRRGRGDSDDHAVYSVACEIEDIEALIDAVGGRASLLGLSSGGALALQAAVQLASKVERLVVFEVPYNGDEQNRQAWESLGSDLERLIQAKQPEQALNRFMGHFGNTPEQIAQIQASPLWTLFVAAAPSLAYDTAVLGKGNRLPTELVQQITIPTLVLDGGASYDFVHATARRLAELIPQAQHRTLVGETHAVSAQALAHAVRDFFIETGLIPA